MRLETPRHADGCAETEGPADHGSPHLGHLGLPSHPATCEQGRCVSSGAAGFPRGHPGWQPLVSPLLSITGLSILGGGREPLPATVHSPTVPIPIKEHVSFPQFRNFRSTRMGEGRV